MQSQGSSVHVRPTCSNSLSPHTRLTLSRGHTMNMLRTHPLPCATFPRFMPQPVGALGAEAPAPCQSSDSLGKGVQGPHRGHAYDGKRSSSTTLSHRGCGLHRPSSLPRICCVFNLARCASMIAAPHYPGPASSEARPTPGIDPTLYWLCIVSIVSSHGETCALRLQDPSRCPP